MGNPEGTLTAAQHETLEVIWLGPASGMTVTEVWQAIVENREVTRTTVLNQVDRLEKRGWLRRKKNADGFRYSATQSRAKAARQLAEDFVDSFFGGSASELVMSLLGSKKLKPTDVDRLRDLLESEMPSPSSKTKES